MMIIKDGTYYLQIVCSHSLLSIMQIINIQFNELSAHSQMNAQTITLYSISYPPGSNSAPQSFDLQSQGQTVPITPILWVMLKRVNVKSPQQQEHSVLIYCILNAEINVILLQ